MNGPVEYQVRRYQITPGKLDQFIAAWITGVVPLRERFGFRFHGAWAIHDTNEFIWVISHDGPEGFEAADARYYASNERSQLSPDPAQWVIEVRHSNATAIL